MRLLTMAYVDTVTFFKLVVAADLKICLCGYLPDLI